MTDLWGALDPTDEHEHAFGPFEWSRFGGSYRRECQVPGCRFVTLDADDDGEDQDR